MIEKNEMPAILNVLSLEDSDIDFEIISEQLVKAGYNLNISRTDEEAKFLSLIRNNTFDVILADFNLPQFDAFEALKLCNKHCPDVPFICVSGSIGEITAIELLKNGAIDYVLKDRLERLPFAIKRALEETNEKKARKLAEEELKKKEINYRTLTENIPDVIARLDKDWKYIYINPAIEKVTGLAPSAFLGKTNEEAGMPEENVVVWNKHMRYVFQKAEQRIFEFVFQTPDGIRYFSLLIVPELSEDGKVNSILTVARDISQHKLAEIALRKSEERLRDIVFSTADWVWETDQNGKYTYSSQKGADFFEASQEEIIGKTPFDFMPEGEAQRVASIFTEIVAKKAPIIDLENWNIGKGNKKICLLTNGLPILNDEGELIGYRGIDKDITERKLAEQELINAKEKAEESEQKYKQIFDNTFDFMSVYEVTEDLRFKVITFNPAEEQLIGSLENYQNKYIDECIPPELYVQFKRNYLRCIKEEKLIVYEEDISFLNINKTFYTQLIPLKNTTGRIHRIIVISRDITDNKRLNSQLTNQNEKLKLLNLDLTIAKEKAEVSDRLKTAFMNNISHEVRTPLNGILGFSQIITDPAFSTEEKEGYYRLLNESCDRLLNTVTNIMDISLLASGNQKITNKEVVLCDLISSISEKFSMSCEQKNIKIYTPENTTNTQHKIFTDEELLGKIFYQLIDNAVKFTSHGTITVGCEKNKNDYHFFVKDSGIGISEEHKSRIFDNFEQEDFASTRKYEGSGIGLSIAKGFVELLGGRICLDSEKGKGSTFYFTLPIPEKENS